MRRALLLLPLLAACGPPPGDTGWPALEGPLLSHEPPAGPFTEGDEVPLEVEASDPDGVASARLYWRVQGSDSWEWEPLELVEGDELDGRWAGSLEAREPGLEYYFKAADGGEPSAVSYLPAGAESAPFAVEVQPECHPLPFVEDFEGGSDLWSLGWLSVSLAFPGYPWRLDEGVEGQGAYHSLGNGDPDDQMEDWLVSPPLDLSGMEQVQLSFYQRGSGGDEAHLLYVSTGSPDPADGDFEELAELEPAPGEWTRSAVVDLSDWAGFSPVYLAWVYRGAAGGSWSLDDVRVEELHASLSASADWEAGPVHPGETGELVVLVENTTSAPAEGVSLELSFPEGGASAEPSASTLDVPGLGSAEARFAVTVDAGWPDDSYLPLVLRLDDGQWSWEQELSLLVGYRSTARFSWELDAATTLVVSLGVGDPDEPSWEQAVYAEPADAGEGGFELDLTEHHDDLPPAAGEHRWFARVEGYADGRVTGFSIESGGETYEATVLPELVSGGEALVYLPEPPAPELLSYRTDPDPLEPGAEATLSLRLVNGGAATQGAVTASLSCSDPDVNVLDGGPVELSGGTWEPGQLLEGSSIFDFSVSESHVDSTPLDCELLLVDEAETFSLELPLEVPWPVFRIRGVEIDDGAAGDGLLDAGESATLTLTLGNAGDLDSDGLLHGTLTLLGSSTASAVVDGETHSFGAIDAGETRDEDFEVEVLDGAAGDVLDFQLDLWDERATYSTTFELVLGEPPWISLGAVDDPVGDALGGDFDWVNVSWRVWDGSFQLDCTSATDFDPSTLFIEAWGESPGADWTWYRLVYQSGTAVLQGYSPETDSFVDLLEPQVDVLSTTELRFTWAIEDMGLAVDALSWGFGAGWCGPPSYYCDEFPDDWGYPYDSFDSGAWLDAEW